MMQTPAATLTSTTICEIPLKAQKTIFQQFSQEVRQNLRLVSPAWNRIIVQEFPIELLISNTNYASLFKCANAFKVTISSLTDEFSGEVGFGQSVRQLEITGKALSSNLIKILHSCPSLECLLFSSLKQVIGIETSEPIVLPKLSTIEFIVRPDQETFTSDEMIIMCALKASQLESLENILISVSKLYEFDDEDSSEGDSAQGSEGFSLEESTHNIMTSVGVSPSFPAVNRVLVPNYPSVESHGGEVTLESANQELQEHPSSHPFAFHAPISGVSDIIVATGVSAQVSEISSGRPLTVAQSAGVGSTTTSGDNESLYSAGGINEFDFASRLFTTRLAMQLRGSDEDLDTFINDTYSRPDRWNQSNLYSFSTQASVKNAAFFELVRGNCGNLKKFIVKTRPDFMCFGNLSTFAKDLSKIQVEELEYSFGRSKLCLEFMLLTVQSKLTRIKLHVLDDLWDSVMSAVEKSRNSITEIDLKILSVNEDPINLSEISKCKNLKLLKLFHFFEKTSLNILPVSLNKLVLNGPISNEDLLSFTVRLVNLIEFTLILNNRGGKIDLELFKKFIFMPQIAKLIFIQSQIDVDDALEYCKEKPGIQITVEGPRHLLDITSILYVLIIIEPSFVKGSTDIIVTP